jgi:hypothetical protein
LNTLCAAPFPTFLGYNALQLVAIPPNVTSISTEYAFPSHANAPDMVFCSTTETAYAKTYADENSIPFEICNPWGI